LNSCFLFPAAAETRKHERPNGERTVQGLALARRSATPTIPKAKPLRGTRMIQRVRKSPQEKCVSEAITVASDLAQNLRQERLINLLRRIEET